MNDLAFNMLQCPLDSFSGSYFQVLLDRDPSILTSVDKAKNNMLHVASSRNNKAAVSILLEKGADINILSARQKYPPIYYAILGGQTDCVKYLIEKGCKITELTPAGYTVLHLAVVLEKQQALVALLEIPVVDKEFVDKFKRTALHLAAATGKPDMITTLCKKGCNIQATDQNGCTPLHYAVDDKTFNLLLEFAADKSTLNTFGEKPLVQASVDSSEHVHTLKSNFIKNETKSFFL